MSRSLTRLLPRLLLAAVLALTVSPAFAASSAEPAPASQTQATAALPQVDLDAACTREQAQAYGKQGATDPAAALKGAACYWYLIQGKGDDDPQKLKDATAGRKLAGQAVKAEPTNGEAQYLLAVLTGEVADAQTFFAKMEDGLKLVPQIEKHALLAAKYAPDIDNAGPERALGELYLQTPAPPVSIGDPAKAVQYLEQAVKRAPGYPRNQLRLAEAYLKAGPKQKGCQMLEKLKGETSAGDVASQASTDWDEHCRTR